MYTGIGGLFINLTDGRHKLYLQRSKQK